MKNAEMTYGELSAKIRALYGKRLRADDFARLAGLKNEAELLEIPRQIRDVNRKLMLQSMGYFYEKIRVNKKESDDIDAWINQVRVDLKKNIIRKQNRDINNREIYAYLHDIFGPSTLDLFDIHYEDEDVEEDSAQNKQNDTKESQKEEES